MNNKIYFGSELPIALCLAVHLYGFALLLLLFSYGRIPTNPYTYYGSLLALVVAIEVINQASYFAYIRKQKYVTYVKLIAYWLVVTVLSLIVFMEDFDFTVYRSGLLGEYGYGTKYTASLLLSWFMAFQSLSPMVRWFMYIV